MQIKEELFVNLEEAVYSNSDLKANAASKELRLQTQQQDCFSFLLSTVTRAFSQIVFAVPL